MKLQRKCRKKMKPTKLLDNWNNIVHVRAHEGKPTKNKKEKNANISKWNSLSNPRRNYATPLKENYVTEKTTWIGTVRWLEFFAVSCWVNIGNGNRKKWMYILHCALASRVLCFFLVSLCAFHFFFYIPFCHLKIETYSF